MTDTALRPLAKYDHAAQAQRPKPASQNSTAAQGPEPRGGQQKAIGSRIAAENCLANTGSSTLNGAATTLTSASTATGSHESG